VATLGEFRQKGGLTIEDVTCRHRSKGTFFLSPSQQAISLTQFFATERVGRTSARRTVFQVIRWDFNSLEKSCSHQRVGPRGSS